MWPKIINKKEGQNGWNAVSRERGTGSQITEEHFRDGSFTPLGMGSHSRTLNRVMTETLTAVPRTDYREAGAESMEAC